MDTTNKDELERLQQDSLLWKQRLEKLNRTEVDSSGDFGDQGKATENVEDTNFRRLLFNKIIEDIDEKISLIKSNFFRICQSCSNPISPERLMLVPNTQLCGVCQKDKSEKTISSGFPSSKLLPQQGFMRLFS